jgi:hypothetical protein
VKKVEDGKFQPKQNEAGLFANTRNDKSDFTGRIELECPHCNQSQGYWVDGWKRQTQQGSKYLKIRLRPRQPGRGPNETQSNREPF